MRQFLSSAPGTGDDIDGAYAWGRMAACLAYGTVGGAGMWSVIVALPAMEAEFALDRSEASLAYTLTMVGFALGNLLIGRQIDRRGTAVPLALAAALLGTGFLLAGLAPAFWLVAALQGGMIGMGAGAAFAPLLADISHWFQRRRGIAIAVVACGNYLAGTLWPLAMQPLMSHGGWRFTYLVIGFVCLGLMIPLTGLLRRPSPRGLPATAGTNPSAFRPMETGLSPTTLQGMLFVAGLACCIAMSMPQVHIVSLCADLGYGVARGADMLALMLGAGIFSRLASGWLADRIGGVKTLIIGSVGQGLSLLFYLPSDGLTSLYVVSFIFGLSQGGIVPSYAIIVREYLPASEAGRRTGLVIMATIIGMAIGGWMSGAIHDLTGSYQAAFLNGIAWNLVNLSVMSVLLWRGRPRRGAALPA
ncbi:MFS transporter [Zhengella mangrovi]|uniref:MFS transporter n=1 Tax=Zhengella mangrovi TaxID=1982044 RepID=A0A2G1QHV8_9HYPH|nr:MFS transporter [Zhengella mangrovi]PHP65105.1 MFS transporter [Zhengella mangrovi]